MPLKELAVQIYGVFHPSLSLSQLSSIRAHSFVVTTVERLNCSRLSLVEDFWRNTVYLNPVGPTTEWTRVVTHSHVQHLNMINVLFHEDHIDNIERILNNSVDLWTFCLFWKVNPGTKESAIWSAKAEGHYTWACIRNGKNYSSFHLVASQAHFLWPFWKKVMENCGKE